MPLDYEELFAKPLAAATKGLEEENMKRCISCDRELGDDWASDQCQKCIDEEKASRKEEQFEEVASPIPENKIGRSIKDRIRPVYGVDGPSQRVSPDDPRIFPPRHEKKPQKASSQPFNESLVAVPTLPLQTRQKCVTLFTFSSFPACLDIHHIIQTTKFDDNEELNKILKKGWLIDSVEVAASTTKEVGGMLYQASTLVIVLQRQEVGVSEKEREEC